MGITLYVRWPFPLSIRPASVWCLEGLYAIDDDKDIDDIIISTIDPTTDTIILDLDEYAKRGIQMAFTIRLMCEQLHKAVLARIIGVTEQSIDSFYRYFPYSQILQTEGFAICSVEDLDRIISASADVNKANDAFRAAAKKQWDKHSTDGAIVYDAGTDVANNFFKGAGSDRMFELYNSFRDSNNKMRSAAFIKSSIEQRKAEMSNRDLNYYINAFKNSLKAPDENDY